MRIVGFVEQAHEGQRILQRVTSLSKNMFLFIHAYSTEHSPS